MKYIYWISLKFKLFSTKMLLENENTSHRLEENINQNKYLIKDIYLKYKRALKDQQ